MAVCVIGAMHWTGLFQGALHPYRRWIAGAIFVLAMAPYLLWSVLFPPVLDVTAVSGTLHYEFRDRRTAALFAVYNSTKYYA